MMPPGIGKRISFQSPLLVTCALDAVLFSPFSGCHVQCGSIQALGLGHGYPLSAQGIFAHGAS